MDILRRRDIYHLIQHSESPCVSIYMPTHPASREIREDPTRLKNLLRRARHELEVDGMRSPEARDFLKRAEILEQEIDFWRKQSHGLAMFLTPNEFRLFRLPVEFRETVVVGPGAYVKPLMPLLGADGRFFVLAVSQKDVRLLQGTQYGLDEIDDDLLGAELDEIVTNEDRRQHVQYHSFRAERGPRLPRGEVVFHGQAGGEEDEKKALERYLREVDEEVVKRLGEEGSPLIFAGVDFVAPIYREISQYPHLLEQPVQGSPEHMSLKELHEKALEAVRPWFDRRRQEALERYERLRGSQRVGFELADVVLAAVEGRVDALFLDPQPERWGSVDAQQRVVECHEKRRHSDHDLLNCAVAHTLAHRGDVFALPAEQVPDGALAAAVYRYEMPVPPITKSESGSECP